MNRMRLLGNCVLTQARSGRCFVTTGKRTISAFQGQSKVSGGTQPRKKYVGQWPADISSVRESCGCLRLSLRLRLCSSSFHPSRRAYSNGSSDEDGSEKKIKPVFVAIPNPIKLLKNRIFFWLIRSYFDQDFTLDDFTQGAKQALLTISQQIAEGTLENLEGLLSPKLFQEVKSKCQTLSLKELSSFGLTEEDILHTIPHDITIHYDDRGRKFLFVLMKFWCHSLQSGSSDPEVKGFRIGRPPPGVTQDQFDSLGSVYSCTYEFLRNISPGAPPDWTITYIQHGQLINTEARGLPDDD